MKLARTLRDPFAWIGLAGAAICSLAAAFPVDAAEPPPPSRPPLSVELPCWTYPELASWLAAEGVSPGKGGPAIVGGLAAARVESWAVLDWKGQLTGNLIAILRLADGRACLSARVPDLLPVTPPAPPRGGN